MTVESDACRLPNAFEVRGEPVDTVIATLTQALAEARAGQIRVVAIAMVDEKGHGSHTIAWGANVNRLTVLGAIERMKHRILLMIDQADAL